MQYDASIPRLDPVSDLPFILPFVEMAGAGIALAGGKGLNLGVLLRAGLRVPDGFCITTAAYEAVCAGPVSALTGEPAPGQEIGPWAAAVRAVVLQAGMPQGVEEAIREAYAGLGAEVAVAVRSSATAEDLPDASFAGQQDTFLNVIGAPAVLEAVRLCWASLWTERAVQYRRSRGLGQKRMSLAVLVQRLVDARVSGVLFTANPLTGRRREAVIDAGPGLGETLVSGAATPDHFVVDITGEGVLERRLGAKKLLSRPRRDGGTETVGNDRAQEWCLQDAQLRQLCRLGVLVEDLFDSPQDIEWAVDEAGEVWVLQARSITTLFPVPGPSPRASDGLRAYYSVNASQGMEQPFTPMGASVIRLLISAITAFLGFPPRDPLAGPSFLREAAGRLYLDVTAALRNPLGRRILGAMTRAAEARAGSALDALAGDPRFSAVPRSPWPFVRRGISFLVRAGIPGRLVRSVANPAFTLRKVKDFRVLLERAGRLSPDAGAGDRLRSVLQLFAARHLRLLLGIMPTTALPAEALLSMAGRLLDLGEKDLEEVRRGVPNNPTTEMNQEIGALAESIPPGERRFFLESPPPELADLYRRGLLPQSAQSELKTFLDRHGHRCVAELDVGVARWADDPSPVFVILSNLLRSAGGSSSAGATFRRGAEAAKERMRRLVADARDRGKLRAGLVSFCLRRARSLLGFRETPRALFSCQLHRARQLLLSAGEELARARRLSAREDVFFLTLGEAREALDGKQMRELVEARRAEHRRNAARRAPAVLLSDGTVPLEEGPAAPAPGSMLTGLPASPGVATGRARVIRDPAYARLDPGDILVAPTTDPGWTPLFLTAGGLVMETGGPMAHGAIVAREYGIPAVVAVAGATSRIAAGMTVTVDGSRGTITIR